MDPRKLKRLLDTYREAGVARVQLGPDLKPTSLEYWAASTAQISPADVEGLDHPDQTWAQGAPLALQQAFERIQATYRQPAKGRAQ